MADLLTRLSIEMMLPPVDLLRLVRSAPYRYKVYQVPKKAPGQFRTIAQPAREVKILQYWILRNVLSKFPVHRAATAYKKGASLLQNAKPHASRRVLLKMDFKDFFPSLKATDFRRFLKTQNANFDNDEVSALCSILFWVPKDLNPPELCLSIGAPTSPMLSNILLAQFDQLVSDYCKKRNVAYTRYADDLSFSANKTDDLAAVESMVIALCQRIRSPRLVVNSKKTVRATKRDSRRVTGLVLTNDRSVSLGRTNKRLIRAMVHRFVLDAMPQQEIPRLRGTLAYVNSVEPSFLSRLREKYGDQIITAILTAALK